MPAVHQIAPSVFTTDLCYFRYFPEKLGFSMANGGWAVFCLVEALVLTGKASLFGLAHLVIEGLYVGWLASVEWSLRNQLVPAE